MFGRLAGSWMAALLALGCAPAAAPRAAPPDPCAQVAHDGARLPEEPWVQKLEAPLITALVMWRLDVAYARCSGSTVRSEVGRVVTVDVEYTGEVGALRAAGLETSFDRDGRVDGQIAMERIEALARVPGVVRILIQPHAEPTGGG